MFTGISAKNFRSFEECEFSSGRLNFVLGPNSSGKSSIMQILRIFIQTAEAAESNESSDWQYLNPIVISTEDVTVLDPRELFSDAIKKTPNAEKKMEITARFKIEDISGTLTRRAREASNEVLFAMRFLSSDLNRKLFQQIYSISFDTVPGSLDSEKGFEASVLSAVRQLIEAKIEQKTPSQSTPVLEVFPDLQFNKYSSNDFLNNLHQNAGLSIVRRLANTSRPKILGNRSSRRDVENEVDKETSDVISALLAILSMVFMRRKIDSQIKKSGEISLSVELEMSSGLNSQDDPIKISKIAIRLGDITMFEVTNSTDGINVNCYWVDMEASVKQLKVSDLNKEIYTLRTGLFIFKSFQLGRNMIDANVSLERNLFRVVNQRGHLAGDYRLCFALDILDFCRSMLSRLRFFSVGPHRMKPSPIYALAESSSKSDFTHDLIKKFARKGGASQRKYIDALSRLSNELGFQIRVDKKTEAVYSIDVASSRSLDLFHPISSVGFGIAHVLPILQCFALVDSLYADDSCMVYIEQPEAHLHPKLHTDIADMLLRLALRRDKVKLIIETHSDHLLNRVARRMRDEAKRVSRGESWIGNVKVYYVDKDRTSGISKIQRLPLTERGDFELPFDFLEDHVHNIAGNIPPL